jgi:hypothetical protein
MSSVIETLREMRDAAPTDPSIVKDRAKLEEATQKIADLNLDPEWKPAMEDYKNCKKSEAAESLIVGTGTFAGAYGAGELAAKGEVAVATIPVIGSEIATATFAPIVLASGVVGGVVGAYHALDRIEEHHTECEQKEREEKNAINLANDLTKKVEEAMRIFLDKMKNDGVQNQQEALNQVALLLEKCKSSVQTYKDERFPEPPPVISYRAIPATPRNLTWQAPITPEKPEKSFQTQPIIKSFDEMINEIYADTKKLLRPS